MSLHPAQASSLTVRCGLSTPLGAMIAAASPQGLCGLWFFDQKHLPDWQPWPEVSVRSHPALAQAELWLERYFDQHAIGPSPMLDLTRGSPFQQAVWRTLLDISAGKTCSYGQIAHALGRPNAARAVGAAVGRNPISIIVPCHRVVGASGALTGYAGGLERKTNLLGGESTA
jgi:methylated-DNA-[protein]-cysteine S-methyltransferase